MPLLGSAGNESSVALHQADQGTIVPGVDAGNEIAFFGTAQEFMTLNSHSGFPHLLPQLLKPPIGQCRAIAGSL